MLLPQGKEAGQGKKSQGLRRCVGLSEVWSGKLMSETHPFPGYQASRHRQCESEPADATAAVSRFQGEIFTAANSKGRKKSLTSSEEDPITLPKLHNLLGRLF